MKLGVTLSHEPQCSGTVTLGANSLRSTYSGVSNGVTVSLRFPAPAKADKEKAKAAGYELRIGRFPFRPLGKAVAIGDPDGMVKLIFDAKYGEILGAHILGADATELIAELVLAKRMELTGPDIFHTIHAHPTLSEAVMEAAAAAYGEAISI